MSERKRCRSTIPNTKRKIFLKTKVLISMKGKTRTYANNSNHTIYRKYSLTKIDDPASEGS
jgi:hypothetical protein